jgi:hypothetical protein
MVQVDSDIASCYIWTGFIGSFKNEDEIPTAFDWIISVIVRGTFRGGI